MPVFTREWLTAQARKAADRTAYGETALERDAFLRKDVLMKICDTSGTQPKILDTSPRQPLVNPKELAQALVAEPSDQPPYAFANFPKDPAQRVTLASLRPGSFDLLSRGEESASPVPRQKGEWDILKETRDEAAEKPQTTIYLKAHLTEEFSAWRKHAFEFAEDPQTPTWFRETLLLLFLGLSVPVSPRTAIRFRFLARRLPGWPEQSSLPTKEDPWGCLEHLPVVYKQVPKEAEEEIKEALKELLDLMVKVGVFDEGETHKKPE